MLQQEERYEAIIIGSLMVSVGKETISPHGLLIVLKELLLKVCVFFVLTAMHTSSVKFLERYCILKI
jgi:hypothetical protein